jgi:hypothetical protein
MTDDTSYKAVVSRTDSHKGWPDDATIDVRVESKHRPSRLGAERSIFRYYVVDHQNETVLHTTTRARACDENPSPAEIAGRAKGFARGYIAAREGNEQYIY